MPYARVNGCDLYYEMEGTGPPIVFVHGETHGASIFGRQVAHFVPQHRCLVYDRRGHGRSQVPAYGCSMWNNVQDLIQLLDRLRIDRAVVVAVAMSTTVGATLAIEHPERVAALVLCSWYELDGYPLLEARRQAYRQTFAELHLTMYEVLQRSGRLALCDYLREQSETLLPIFPRRDEDPVVHEELVQLFASHQAQHYLQSGDFYTSIPNVRSQMERVRCPVLGICGIDDPVPDQPGLLEHLPDFRQTWISGARRFPSMERPDEFNRTLEDLLGELDRAADTWL